MVKWKKRHGRRWKVYKRGVIVERQLPPEGAWLIQPDPGDPCHELDQDRGEHPFMLGLGVHDFVSKYMLEDAAAAARKTYTHTFWPVESPPMTFTLSRFGAKYFETIYDELMVEPEFVSPVWDHPDLAYPSPRSGGCGGYRTSQSLVVVPTPCLPAMTTAGPTRSGLTMTLKTTHKPP